MSFRVAGISILLLLSIGCDGPTEVAASASGTGGSSGTTGTGGAGGGTGGGPVLPDGGASDPGNVTCNGGPCASASNYCCDEAPQGAEKCVPASTSACGGLRRMCDEAADCPSPQVCCIPPNQAIAIAYNTFCVDVCKDDPFAYQVCKSDDECQNGLPCVAQPCQGYIIQACGPLPQERCQ